MYSMHKRQYQLNFTERVWTRLAICIRFIYFFLSNTRAQLCTAECHAHRAPTEAPQAAAAVGNGKRHAARSSHVE